MMRDGGESCGPGYSGDCEVTKLKSTNPKISERVGVVDVLVATYYLIA